MKKSTSWIWTWPLHIDLTFAYYHLNVASQKWHRQRTTTRCPNGQHLFPKGPCWTLTARFSMRGCHLLMPQTVIRLAPNNQKPHGLGANSMQEVLLAVFWFSFFLSVMVPLSSHATSCYTILLWPMILKNTPESLMPLTPHFWVSLLLYGCFSAEATFRTPWPITPGYPSSAATLGVK